jgi:hypothetical protein
MNAETQRELVPNGRWIRMGKNSARDFKAMLSVLYADSIDGHMTAQSSLTGRELGTDEVATTVRHGQTWAGIQAPRVLGAVSGRGSLY